MIWVLWCCPGCRRLRLTISWWAERGGCDHGKGWAVSGTGTSYDQPGERAWPQWVKEAARAIGLPLPRPQPPRNRWGEEVS